MYQRGRTSECSTTPNVASPAAKNVGVGFEFLALLACMWRLVDMVAIMQTLHEAWTELSEKLPPEVSDETRRYLRRYFYAGAKSIITLMSTNVSDLVQPTLDDDIYVERLLQEMNFFEEDMAEGRT
jgi:hypothetical protein